MKNNKKFPALKKIAKKMKVKYKENEVITESKNGRNINRGAYQNESKTTPKVLTGIRKKVLISEYKRFIKL